MLLIGQSEIGGGFVRLSFSVDGKRLPAGTPLTADKINSFANKRRLIDAGFISVYPPGPKSDAAAPQGEHHVYHTGKGLYDVVVGTKINDRPLTKSEAEALAATPA